jgi:hypothetical protein
MALEFKSIDAILSAEIAQFGSGLEETGQKSNTDQRLKRAVTIAHLDYIKNSDVRRGLGFLSTAMLPCLGPTKYPNCNLTAASTTFALESSITSKMAFSPSNISCILGCYSEHSAKSLARTEITLPMHKQLLFVRLGNLALQVGLGNELEALKSFEKVEDTRNLAMVYFPEHGRDILDWEHYDELLVNLIDADWSEKGLSDKTPLYFIKKLFASYQNVKLDRPDQVS